MWQTLEDEGQVHRQVNDRRYDVRRLEDMDSAAFDLCRGQSLASGNPLVIEKPRLMPS